MYLRMLPNIIYNCLQLNIVIVNSLMSRKPNQGYPSPFFNSSSSKPRKRKQKQTEMQSFIPVETRPRMTSEQAAERHRSMQEAIQNANRIYSSTSNTAIEIIKKRKKDPQHQQLEKAFAPFSSLEFEVLKRIQMLLDKYTTEEKGNKHGLEMLRYINRKDLFKIFCITIAELRNKRLPACNEVEAYILNPEVDYYSLLSVLASTLQSHLFENLFTENVKSRQEPYQMRMKLLRTHLYDKMNFTLRRGVVNRTLTFEYLEKASDDELKCQERKMQEKKLMERLVRQSQSWEDIAEEKRIKENERLRELERYQQEVTAVQQVIEVSAQEEETAEHRACKEALADAYHSYQKCMQEMKERLEAMKAPSAKRLIKNWENIMENQ